MNKTSYREYMQVIEGVCRGRGERAALQPWSSRCKERRRVPGKESGTYVVVLAPVLWSQPARAMVGLPGHAASAARAIERRNDSKS